MSYGIQINTSSGLTDLSDIYSVRPKETHSLYSTASSVTLVRDQSYEYGTFTALGINYNPATDVYFVTNAWVNKDSGEAKTDHWALSDYASFGISLVDAFELDTSDNKAKLTWYTDFWDSLTITRTGESILRVDFTIVKIKA
jgi:hypothetical protein